MSGSRDMARRQPCAEEWQVIRAMTHDAVLAAARDGRQHRTFHGFRIEARRVGGDIEAVDLIEVRMSVGALGVRRTVKSLKLRATRFRDQHASSKPCRCLATALC